MYAEERQQAMAQLISRRGRLSVAQLAEEFEVTTETVRRDLSALDRMGLVRRVHGGAVPAGSLTVIESGISERDQANTQAKEAIAAAAVALLPPPGLGHRHRRRQHHRPLRRRPPPRPPADRHHPRRARRGPARRPAPDRAPPAARARSARPPTPRSAPTRSPPWRRPRRRRLHRDQRPHRSATGSPLPTATRRRASAPSSPARGVRSCSLTPPRSASRRPCGSPHSRHRHAGHRQRHRAARTGVALEKRRTRGGGRMILTLTPNPSIDRTVTLDGELSRGQVHRVASVTSQAGGKGVNISRAAVSAGIPSIAVVPAAKDDPFVIELLGAGIDCRPVRPAGDVRVNLTITEPDGTTTKLNSPGAAVLAPAHLEWLAQAMLARAAERRLDGAGRVAARGRPAGVLRRARTPTARGRRPRRRRHQRGPAPGARRRPARCRHPT